MRCVRRAMFSLACRFRSYLLLLFGCTVLALSICVCLGIQENMGTVSEQMAAYYGGRIEVFCSEKLLEKTEKKEYALWLPDSDVEKLRTIDGVKDVQCRKYLYADAVDFYSVYKKAYVQYLFGRNIENRVSLYGVEDVKTCSYFEMGRCRLEEGVFETGEARALVSDQLAKTNGWRPGSAFTVSDPISKRTRRLLVAGIFSCPGETDSYGGSNLTDMIFLSTETVAYLAGDGLYNSCSLLLESPYAVECVMQDVRKLDLETGDLLEMVDGSIDYRNASLPLQSIQNMMRLISASILILGALVLVIYICNILFERRVEIGILFALGERRRYILGQIAVETSVILMVSCILATGLGAWLVPMFRRVFLSSLGLFGDVKFMLSARVCLTVALLFFLMELVLMVVPLWMMAKDKPREILAENGR